MLKTMRVSAMPVAVRLTPSRGGGEPAQTGEQKSEVRLQANINSD